MSYRFKQWGRQREHKHADQAIYTDYGRMPSQQEEDSYHFQTKQYIMSKPEADFFMLLSRLIGDTYHIFPQIHLGTVTLPKTTKIWRSQSGRVQFPRLWHLASIFSDKYSLDFIICDKQNIRPVLAIELDDSTHHWRERQRRDRFVERVLREARLPLVRIEYADAEIESVVAARLSMLLPMSNLQ